MSPLSEKPNRERCDTEDDAAPFDRGGASGLMRLTPDTLAMQTASHCPPGESGYLHLLCKRGASATAAELWHIFPTSF